MSAAKSGTRSRPLSATLEIAENAGEGGRGPVIRCVGCGHKLGPAGKPWKQAARLDETPMRGAAGAPYSTGAEVLLRRFYCPNCATLLDTETALPGDPFLDDVIEV
jgi:acetone carboxylase gamma subunit